MVAHPPCTYLSHVGGIWWYHPEDKHLPMEERRPHPKFPNRKQDREDGVEFFMKLANAPIKYIAIENPVGCMNSRWRKPNQIIHPWQFGDEASKRTCLWTKNLPNLVPTKIVGKGEYITYKSGKKLAKWYAEALNIAKTPQERSTIRSKTFPGIAKAIAEQWSEYILKDMEKEK